MEDDYDLALDLILEDIESQVVAVPARVPVPVTAPVLSTEVEEIEEFTPTQKSVTDEETIVADSVLIGTRTYANANDRKKDEATIVRILNFIVTIQIALFKFSEDTTGTKPKPNSKLGKIIAMLDNLYNKIEKRNAKRKASVGIEYFPASYLKKVWDEICKNKYPIPDCKNGCWTNLKYCQQRDNKMTTSYCLSYDGITKTVQLMEIGMIVELNYFKQKVATDLQMDTTRNLQVSHLDHCSLCANPYCGIIEIQSRNSKRNSCISYGKCHCNLYPACKVDCHPRDSVWKIRDLLDIKPKTTPYTKKRPLDISDKKNSGKEEEEL